MSQQNADTWTTMAHAMEQSRTLINSGGGTATERAEAEEILQRGARIAYATRSGSMAEQPIPGEGGDLGAPSAVIPGRRGRDVGAGAAGRVQEEMGRFVQIADRTAGVYQPPVDNPSGVGPPTPLEEIPPGGLGDTLDRRESDKPGPRGSGPRFS